MTNEHDELEPLEELEELEELPAQAPHAAPEPTSATSGGKRELEETPIILRKTSKMLLFGALLPYFTATQYAAAVGTAPEGAVADPFPWKQLIIAKIIVLVGAWILQECAEAKAGTKPNSKLAGIASAHALAPAILAGLVWIGAIVYLFGAPIPLVDGRSAFRLGAEHIAELLTLILATATFTHIFAYEHGGKFNPIFPLMFLGPGLAGLLNMFSIGAVMGGSASGMGMLGILGSVLCAAGGCMAMYAMYVAMKQAKEEGDRKREELRMARKAAREAQRASRSEGSS